MKKIITLASCYCILAAFTPAQTITAQNTTSPDSLRQYDLDTIVVTADRTPTALRTSISAVSYLDDHTISTMPSASVSSMLEMIPGFNFLSLDGLGYDPQVTVRGFYGGGEAEYVTLLIDGRPVNSIERGLIDWNLLTGIDIESVEAVRGTVSSLYGDVTVGGIINVRTKAYRGPSTSVSTTGGSFQSYEGSLAHSGRTGTRAYSVFAGGASTDGYRDHATRRFVNLGGSADVFVAGNSALKLDTRHYWRSAEIPGPVASSVDVSDSLSTSASPLYRFDESDERRHELGLAFHHDVDATTSIDFNLSGQLRDLDEFATLELFPGFGDTQNRTGDSRRASVGVLGNKSIEGNIPVKITAGVDGSIGHLENKYFGFLTGSTDDYAMAQNLDIGALQSQSEIKRLNGSVFTHVDAMVVPAVRLSAGVRFDAVEDSFDPVVGGALEEAADKSHTAWSPRAGVNARIIQTDTHVGNVYGSLSRTFKTPTLDQLYDQRLIPFGEFSISLSNGQLDPQTGTAFEVGYYHSFRSANGAELSGSLAVYTIDMENELDFDLATFTYTNLGKSRHRGVEAGLSGRYKGIRSFLNYTLQDVTLQFGANDGNYVKAIPRTLIVVGTSYEHKSGIGGSLKGRHSRDAFLDDENTIELPNYSVVDARLFYVRGQATISLTVANLFDESYSTTGYLLSVEGLGSQTYMYPAAGRYLKAGVALQLR